MAGTSTALPIAFVLFSCVLVFVEMRVVGEMEKRFFNFNMKCKKLGQNCRGFPRCCGDLQCYFEHDFNPIAAAQSLTSGKAVGDMFNGPGGPPSTRDTDRKLWTRSDNSDSDQGGVCVPCVTDGLKCQRDKQCCEGLQCDKEGKFDINGKCNSKRKDGATCHGNSMCEGYCDKHWTDFYGVCASKKVEQ